MQKALLYEKLGDSRVRCRLCAHYCVIPEGRFGACSVRQNIDGELNTLVYGHTISQQVDPVEKKPLYHFYPGSRAFSIATPGCNFRCRWCQNWEIAHLPREHGRIEGYRATPEEIVRHAAASGSRSIAYTYTEPTVFFEYTYEIASVAHENGIANIYVTNGYMTPEMLDAFHPLLDAANVDLKSFDNRVYHRYVGGGLQPVLESLRKMKELGIWVEVTTLIIPGVNDHPDELRELTRFIAHDLGPETPWHISRFFPAYKMTGVPPTPLQTLDMAREIGLEEGLQFVYLGNTAQAADTCCPQCGTLLIRRFGYTIQGDYLQNGHCPNCHTSIAGVWDDHSSD